VFAAIEELNRRLFDTDDLTGRRFTIVGLGQVGGRLATRLAGRGAVLTVTDIDAGKQAAARELGATWAAPDEAAFLPTDVLVPAALGGLLTSELVARLDCRAVVGPANNQLAAVSVADELAARGIVWAPDFVVNAGGVIHGALVDIGGGPVSRGIEQSVLIGPRLGRILDAAESAGITPYAAALTLARQRVQQARVARSMTVDA
jgi:leucine dehydrogenase